VKEIIIYEPKEHIKPYGLIGISDAQIDDHWKLYLGYVSQVNRLNDEIVDLVSQKQTSTLVYLDRKRRFGFEYNGMVLHEYYFGNLCSKCSPPLQGSLLQEMEIHWGSFQDWLDDFANTGKTRGIGWSILYMDPVTGQLLNAFIQEHENGHIAGFVPLLVMDVWEHAYMVDFKAMGRADYINAFIANINWKIVEDRYDQGTERKLCTRF